MNDLSEYARNVIREEQFTVWPANEKTRDIPEPQVERYCPCGTCRSVQPPGSVGYLIVSGEQKGISLNIYDEDQYQGLLAIYGGDE